MSKLTLAGAGPGDPELITVKALKAIQTADVILYDALSNDQLLNHASPHCEKIYVGKRGGFDQTEQDEINRMIVAKAAGNRHVVRLKGGDPFVFGRGYEEMEYASSRGITVEIIPGISSAIALPELAGIPLTTRAITESFWVTTGVTRHQSVSDDIRAAAKTNCTVVILMGMKNLSHIASIFLAECKGSLPVAIIQNGSTPQEKICIGTIENILEKAAESGIGSPAIIVVGRVVSLRNAPHSGK